LDHRFIEAQKVYLIQRAVFNELDESLPERIKGTWKTLSTTATKGRDGIWTSVFSPRYGTGMFNIPMWVPDFS
jgi:hypothetical protein